MDLTIEEKLVLFFLLEGFYIERKKERDEEAIKLLSSILQKLGIKNPDEVKNERKQK